MSSWKSDTIVLPRRARRGLFSRGLMRFARRLLLVRLVVDVEAEGVHAQPQLGALLVLDVEVVHPVHLQVLGDLQVLHHGLLSET